MNKDELIDKILASTNSLKARQKTKNDEEKQRVTLGNNYLVLIAGFIVIVFVCILVASTVGFKHIPGAAKGFLAIIILLMAIPVYKIVVTTNNPYAALKKENESRKNQAFSLRQKLKEEDDKTLETILLLLQGDASQYPDRLFQNRNVKWILRNKTAPSFFCAALSGTHHEYYIAGSFSSVISALWVDALPFVFKPVEGHAFEYTPSKIMVGGAVSGGVAVGGAFDAGNFITSSKYDTNKCQLILTVCNIDYDITAVEVQPCFLNAQEYAVGFSGFERIGPYKVVLEHDSKNLSRNYHSLMARDPGVGLSLMVDAINETYMTTIEARVVVKTLYSIARSGRSVSEHDFSEASTNNAVK